MRKYTQEHEWIDVEGNIATIGITNHAQDSLGDIVFIELPSVGKEVKQGDNIAVIESVKAASDIYAPIEGKVVEVNEAIVDDNSIVNSDAEGNGWFFKIEISAPSQLDALLDKEDYDKLI